MEVLCVSYWKWISPVDCLQWSCGLLWSIDQWNQRSNCYLISCSELVRLYENLLPQRFSIADCNSIPPFEYFSESSWLFLCRATVDLAFTTGSIGNLDWRGCHCSRCHGRKSASEIPLCHWSRRDIHRYACEEKGKWGSPNWTARLHLASVVYVADVIALCPNGKVRVMKLLSEDPSYSDAPREAIRRILAEVCGENSHALTWLHSVKQNQKRQI